MAIAITLIVLGFLSFLLILGKFLGKNPIPFMLASIVYILGVGFAVWVVGLGVFFLGEVLGFWTS